MRRPCAIVMVFGAILVAGSPAWAKPPRVVKAVPDNGDVNVDPGLREIRVTFDQDMADGYSWVGGGEAYPKTHGRPRWVDSRTCVLSVTLQPNHVYQLSINSSRFRNFRSRTGVPAEAYPIAFKTGPGKGAAKGKQRRAPKPKSAEKLAFTLRDACGREVRAEDYSGAPVLLLSGACWCGGCQQDMHEFKKISDTYGPAGLQLIRSVAGENELASLEFQKHYRLNAVHLLDSTREFEWQYHRDGWPFIMLTDKTGSVVFKANGTLVKEILNLKPLLHDVMESAQPQDNVTLDGVRYMPATAKRSGESDAPSQCDRFPSIACGKDGRVFVVFTSNRNGSNDVFVRIFDGSKWSKDIPVAASDADEFDADVTVDADGDPWISWTSNAAGERYNVFVAVLADPSEAVEPAQLTDAEDDAMHARMATDRDGNIWVTYYKWHKMGPYSRDKEVYVCKCNGAEWSDEIRVSPTDVPTYEDHTDPAIAALGDGVVICWSWDFHRPKGYTQDAREPTIFYRTIDGNTKLAEPRYASGKDIDSTPSVAVDGKRRVWCAWESLAWDRRAGACRNRVFATRCDPTAPRPRKPEHLAGPLRNVCGPSMAAGPDNALALVWCECSNGNDWIMKYATCETAKDRWSSARTIAGKREPRFPAAAYDAKGNLWVAYSERTDAGREISVVKLP
jgi:peroxiredoxin